TERSLLALDHHADDVMGVAALISLAKAACACLLRVDLLQRGRDRRTEIGRFPAAIDAAGRSAAARGALQRLVLAEDRTAHLQQSALVDRAHLSHPSWARRVATRPKKYAKRVPKKFIPVFQQDDWIGNEEER